MQTLSTSNTPPNSRSLPPNTANSGTPGASVNNPNAFSNTDNVSTLLQIVPVIIKIGNKSVKANALLYSGSDVALINKDLASKLNLSGDSKVLNICNTISEVSKVEYKPVEFQIPSVCNSFQKSDINVFVVDTLNVQPNNFKISSLKNDYPQLRDISFLILNSSNVDLPIGTKYLLNNLVSVFIRFRQGEYTVMADIEKMFHQIFVSPNDTNALRFLWRESPDEVVSDYKTLVHLSGKVDLPCCANWALRKVPEMVDKSLKRVVANNFYMDDFLRYLCDEESLIRLSFSLISCLKACGFRLTKWVSNSKVILENIPSSEFSHKFRS